jgi:uncharacterized protein (UPF0254 family)
MVHNVSQIRLFAYNINKLNKNTMKEFEIKHRIARAIAEQQPSKDGINKSTENIYEILKEQLILSDVVASLPTTKEIESRIKHVIENSFEDYEVVEKREYSLGFRACFNWLKIKQMKNKG